MECHRGLPKSGTMLPCVPVEARLGDQLGTDSTELIDSLQERGSDSCNKLHALLQRFIQHASSLGCVGITKRGHESGAQRDPPTRALKTIYSMILAMASMYKVSFEVTSPPVCQPSLG